MSAIDSVYQAPYESGASLLDCTKSDKGYNSPAYTIKRECDMTSPNCDNRSYSAYATQGIYSGYQGCLAPSQTKPMCDLVYLNAPPVASVNCWRGCTANNTPTLDCNQSCVIQGMLRPPPGPSNSNSNAASFLKALKSNA